MMKWWTIELIILYDVIVVRCLNLFYIIFYITLHELSCLAIPCNSRFWICERQAPVSHKSNTIATTRARTADYGPWTNLRRWRSSLLSLLGPTAPLANETSSWHQPPQSICESTWHRQFHVILPRSSADSRSASSVTRPGRECLYILYAYITNEYDIVPLIFIHTTFTLWERWNGTATPRTCTHSFCNGLQGLWKPPSGKVRCDQIIK